MEAYTGLTRLVVHDEEGNAELRCFRLEALDGYCLAFVLVVVYDAHLVGEHDFGREVIVGGDARKRIGFVLQRLVEVPAGFIDELHHALFAYGGTKCECVDEHAYGIADAEVGTSVADGGYAQLLVVGKA